MISESGLNLGLKGAHLYRSDPDKAIRPPKEEQPQPQNTTRPNRGHIIFYPPVAHLPDNRSHTIGVHEGSQGNVRVSKRYAKADTHGEFGPLPFIFIAQTTPKLAPILHMP